MLCNVVDQLIGDQRRTLRVDVAEGRREGGRGGGRGGQRGNRGEGHNVQLFWGAYASGPSFSSLATANVQNEDER